MIEQIWPSNVDLLKGGAWQFDWAREIHTPERVVFKLTTIENPSIIQGLISVENNGDHIFVHLIESAEFNKGRQKLFEGVPGNLFAFACKLAFEKGYNGFVAFDSKTVLIPHYEKTLDAKRLSGIRMFFNREAAYKLTCQYFKDFDNATQ